MNNLKNIFSCWSCLLLFQLFEKKGWAFISNNMNNIEQPEQQLFLVVEVVYCCFSCLKKMGGVQVKQPENYF